MKLFITIGAALLLVGVVSTSPLPIKYTNQTTSLSDQVDKRDVPYFCEEYPEALPCTLFCRGSGALFEYCHPEYCDDHPEHWSCQSKYIDDNGTVY